MGKKSRHKKECKEARAKNIAEYEEWVYILKKKCNYYAIAWLVLFYFFPFIFIALFEVSTAVILMGFTWFIASTGYFLIFKYYAKSVNEFYYNLLSKSRYGHGTMVSAVYQLSRGGILLMIILGGVSVYQWMT
ncbi:hypothetical protein [Shewanella ulleungensis]|jgi:hypothetical protein|uniref:DUF2628 domain-containing protein n=1 Tax=Shewanella ulleungensis TaxID=2282699 RepID=A0ABQ2QV45_9GAMM|nr:hypothetical protein [Shewanella ulleungensis]MCL1150909.1 hypothetical protein [Shewanella ulleungensis]GGP95270.1 hypothetical protein GCM10009410_31580 [Shewanella ulleungensis]